MKHNKFTKLLAIILVIVFSCNMLTACNIEQYFVFGGSSQNLEENEEVKINPNVETFEARRTPSSSPCITTTVMKVSTLPTSGWA